MKQQFKGVPISSRSQMNIPVTVVSQPSSTDIYGGNNDNDENKSTSVTNEAPEAPAEVTEAAKAEALRTGEVKISELLPVDFDDFMHSSIVAIPKRLPSILDVHAKDPNYRLRWVNCKADGGRMVDERKAMGFSVAKIDEVVAADGKPLMRDSALYQTDGILKYHDVICMKVLTRLLWGWYKYNAESSAAKVAPRKLHKDALEKGREVLNSGLSGQDRGGRSLSEIRDLISLYDPGTGR